MHITPRGNLLVHVFALALVFASFALSSTVAASDNALTRKAAAVPATIVTMEKSFIDAVATKSVANNPNANQVGPLGKSPDRPRRITVERLDASSLSVAVDTPSGTRVLFQSEITPEGRRKAQIFAIDRLRHSARPLIGRPTGNESKTPEVSVGGVNLFSALKEKRDRNATDVQFQSFVAYGDGMAVMQAIPILYANFEDDAEDLLAPFGVIAMGIQLVSGVYTGFVSLDDDVVSPSIRQNMLSACFGQKDCFVKGRTFTVRPSGIFDVVSKSTNRLAKSAEKDLRLPPRRPVSAYLSILTAPSVTPRAKNGNGTCDDPGPCFGYCGPACDNPGQIWTPACFHHDYCVCAYGHDQCVISVPEGCLDCATLIEAVLSYGGSLLEWFLSWFSDGGGGNPCDQENPICQGG
jgi:hypothetical protein